MTFYRDYAEGALVDREFDSLMKAVDQRHHSSFRFNLVNQAVVREVQGFFCLLLLHILTVCCLINFAAPPVARHPCLCNG